MLVPSDGGLSLLQTYLGDGLGVLPCAEVMAMMSTNRVDPGELNMSHCEGAEELMICSYLRYQWRMHKAWERNGHDGPGGRVLST